MKHRVCTIPHCENRTEARGWCRKHYNRWYRTGDPLKVRPHPRVSGKSHGNYRHGLWNHPAYKVWNNMLARCGDPTNAAYKNYGGRGITVCDRWRDVRNFVADMGERPPGGTIERVDNDGNYEPSNCKWIPPSEQDRNRRFCKLNFEKADQIRQLRAQGVPRGVVAERFGVSVATIKKVSSGAYWARPAEKVAANLRG